MSAQERFVMTVDTRRCVGCSACVLACMAENNIPEGYCRDWIVHEIHGEFPNLQQEIRSERCMHCNNAPCVNVCPTGASFYARGGIVLVDPDLCTGCKACIASCPYDARYVHPDGHVDKCTFCLHRVERGDLPACATVCPTKALTFGNANDPTSAVAVQLRTRSLKVLKPEAGTEPNVFFLK
ncbi:MAG: 4Fe-4S dicluster domain-containing protein [Polyangiaceae bacterium]